MELITKKLMDCCDVISDGDHLPPPKTESGIPFITISNITATNHISFDDVMYVPEEYYKALPESKKAQEGDILYSVVGSFGIPVYVNENQKFIFQRHIALLRPNQSINGKYLYYLMCNPIVYKRIDKLAIGCSQKTVTLDTLRNFLIDLPDKDTQDKIASILTTIDEKIDTNYVINKNLESLAKTIYDYWFLQFEFPNEEEKPYKSSGGKMVWNEKIKREIPERWKAVNLLDVADWESSGQPPKSQFVFKEKEGYIRFIQNRDYDSDDHKTYIPYTEDIKTATRFDILMDKYGDAGAIRCGIEGAFNVALGKIKPRDEAIQEYLRAFLGDASVYNYLHNSSMASTRASLSEKNLSSLNLVIPARDILLEYQDFAHKLRQTIFDLNDENQELTALRDFLLPLLMNGQVGFKDE